MFEFEGSCDRRCPSIGRTLPHLELGGFCKGDKTFFKCSIPIAISIDFNDWSEMTDRMSSKSGNGQHQSTSTVDEKTLLTLFLHISFSL